MSLVFHWTYPIINFIRDIYLHVTTLVDVILKIVVKDFIIWGQFRTLAMTFPLTSWSLGEFAAIVADIAVKIIYFLLIGFLFNGTCPPWTNRDLKSNTALIFNDWRLWSRVLRDRAQGVIFRVRLKNFHWVRLYLLINEELVVLGTSEDGIPVLCKGQLTFLLWLSSIDLHGVELYFFLASHQSWTRCSTLRLTLSILRKRSTHSLLFYLLYSRRRSFGW